MDRLNCLRCEYEHKDNGNCTAVGGFCTAVPAAHCKKLKEYLDTGLTPEEIIGLCEMDKRAKMADLLRLEEYQSLGDIARLRQLAEADRDGRCVVLPELEQKIGDPLEPLKVFYALSSEVHKYEYREANKPEDISILDYTIIAALKDVLTRSDAEAALGKEQK